jgi:hypothetical protein
MGIVILVMTTMSDTNTLYLVHTPLNLHISNLVQLLLAPNQEDDDASGADTVEYDSDGDRIPGLIEWVE